MELAGPRPDSAHGLPGRDPRTEAVVVLALAVLAALAVKTPELFGYRLVDGDLGFYARNLTLFSLPLLTGYFAWKRRLDAVRCFGLTLPFIGAAVFANVYPFTAEGATEGLTALHLPIALWLVVGIAHAGGSWPTGGRGMGFVRFSAEFSAYYGLTALGGGGLTLLTWALFSTIDVDISPLARGWVLPCGAMGAVIVCAWLVEMKPGIVESIARVLIRGFTPLVAMAVLAFLVTLMWTGRGVDANREALIAFDLLLALVVGMALYSVAVRDPQAPPNPFDAVQGLLTVSAIIADVVALAAIAARISEFGFSPNKVAALGENLILLVNLVWSAWLYAGFLRRRDSSQALFRWQEGFLPVYALWAAVVVVVFPPLFGYV